jgi:hypothetical protein
MRLLVLLLTLAVFPVHAQKPAYAVASLIGDRLLVVVADKSVGSNIDRNRLDEGTGIKPMIDVIAPAAQKAGATHLIIALKNRDDARLRVADGMVGLGKLEGLGFYVDNVMRMTNSETGEGAVGFVAPFAYIRFLLVDLNTGATLREQVVRESHAVSSQKATVAWDALPAEQKVQLLQHLIRTAVDDAIPELLGKP